MPPKRAAVVRGSPDWWRALAKLIQPAQAMAQTLAIDQGHVAAVRASTALGAAMAAALEQVTRGTIVQQPSSAPGPSRPARPPQPPQQAQSGSQQTALQRQQSSPALRQRGPGRPPKAASTSKPATTPKPAARPPKPAASKAGNAAALSPIEEYGEDCGAHDSNLLASNCATFGVEEVVACMVVPALLDLKHDAVEHDAALLTAYWTTVKRAMPEDVAEALQLAGGLGPCIAAAKQWWTARSRVEDAPQVDAAMSEGASPLGARLAGSGAAVGEPQAKRGAAASYADVARSASTSPHRSRSRSPNRTASGGVSRKDQSTVCMECCRSGTCDTDPIMLCHDQPCKGAMHRSCAGLAKAPKEWRCKACAATWSTVGRNGKATSAAGAAAGAQ